jgi:hypothetical protein
VVSTLDLSISFLGDEAFEPSDRLRDFGNVVHRKRGWERAVVPLPIAVSEWQSVAHGISPAVLAVLLPGAPDAVPRFLQRTTPSALMSCLDPWSDGFWEAAATFFA